MIILIWFTVVCFLMLLGLTICGLTFRHWYVQSRMNRDKLRATASAATEASEITAEA